MTANNPSSITAFGRQKLFYNVFSDVREILPNQIIFHEITDIHLASNFYLLPILQPASHFRRKQYRLCWIVFMYVYGLRRNISGTSQYYLAKSFFIGFGEVHWPLKSLSFLHSPN